ncbi:MAG: hypothetical protein MJZ68_03725 [archaeon]|nr:hypothetical protein [archaeon]
MTVPMVVTGAYGMNVDLPLQEDHFAFDVIFWFTACIVGGLLICFRKKHIL